MKFIQIGNDEAAAAFARVALAHGYHMVGYIPVSSDLPPPPEATRVTMKSIEDVSSLSDVDFLLLSGRYEERSDYLKYILRLDPIDLVVSTPISEKPDTYYEVSLMQGEAKTCSFPLMPEVGHRALDRINEIQVERGLGGVRWVEWMHPLGNAEGPLRFLDGWTWVREMVGDIETLSATGSGDIERPSQVVVSARARTDLVSTSRWLASPGKACKFHVELDHGSIDCELPDGFSGPANLRWTKEGTAHSEELLAEPVGERWFRLWQEFKAGDEATEAWRLATRQIELAEAVDRSLSKGRTVDLTYDEVTEEASFKSIMSIFGCSLIWITLLVAILAAAGVPYVGYVVLPVLVLFVLLQFLGLVFRKKE